MAEEQLHDQWWPVPCYSTTSQVDKRPGGGSEWLHLHLVAVY